MIHFQVQLRALTPEEGGSRHPFGSGYRALLHYDDDPESLVHGVEVRMTLEKLAPGEEALVDVVPFYPHNHTKPIGATFELRDGAHKRSVGRILAIVTA